MDRAYKFVPQKKDCFSGPIKAWNIEEPEVQFLSSDASLVISGWVVGHTSIPEAVMKISGLDYRASVDLSRPDVSKAVFGESTEQPDENHLYGFRIDTGLALNSVISFELGFVAENEVYWLGTYIFEENTKVLKGKDEWLFLENDTNDSVGQYTGRVEIAFDERSAWKLHLATLENLSAAEGFSWSFLISPAKEYVLRDYYPYEIARNNVPAQFLDMFDGNRKIIYPIKILADNKELAYWRGDTHWTDYGAYLAFKEVIKSFDLDLSEFERKNEIQYQIISAEGDLSEKLTPSKVFPNIKLASALRYKNMVYDNCVRYGGNIAIYENESPVSQSTIVIFGSSSSYVLGHYLSLYFKRVVRVHSAASVDLEILKLERPEYVLLQSNSRFLITAPESIGNYSVRLAISEKLNSLGNIESRKLSEDLKYYNSNVKFEHMNSYNSMTEMLHKHEDL